MAPKSLPHLGAFYPFSAHFLPKLVFLQSSGQHQQGQPHSLHCSDQTQRASMPTTIWT